ncbi:MAG: pantetheine-phosphate adenylyltransferase [Flavobacteriales bacterium]|nr:pantetheine-phosphate adenylyltransferase [Flavobacteriales bacterium]
MKRIAVFPGSFDPITLGHSHIVERASSLFDVIVVAIGTNTTKQYLFPLNKRIEWTEKVFKNLSNVRVVTYEGLTVDFCKSLNANYILRGLRNGTDFDFEQSIATMNKTLNPAIETILLNTDPAFAAIHSSIVREIIKNKGDVSSFVPPQINVYE